MLKRLRTSFPVFDAVVDAIEHSVVQNTVSVSNIVTHNGTFHCDEALACGMLKVLPEFQKMSICRTRDVKLIDTGFIVVDVGATFDVSKQRFDHHQNSFQETFNAEKKIKLSSAGLVYKYFGKRIIHTLFPALSLDNVDLLHLRLYDAFVEEIDGIDNGVEAFEVEGGGGVAVTNYRITTNLSSRVSKLNSQISEEQSARFVEAMEVTFLEFFETLQYFAQTWLPARIVVEQCIAKANMVHVSGEIIRMDGSVPWKSHLLELDTEKKIKFCLFKDESNDQWRVQTVPKDNGGFAMRVPLKWKGLRDDELSKESGIPGGVFVHASGFIGGNKTYEGALQMAIQSLAN